jgi:hypothetical protein
MDWWELFEVWGYVGIFDWKFGMIPDFYNQPFNKIDDFERIIPDFCGQPFTKVWNFE